VALSYLYLVLSYLYSPLIWLAIQIEPIGMEWPYLISILSYHIPTDPDLAGHCDRVDPQGVPHIFSISSYLIPIDPWSGWPF